MKPRFLLQQGASLIEVLVAILILSFGMLALGAMLSFAIQLPKLSGYRSTAVNLASGHIERIRANAAGFTNGFYSAPTAPMSYDGTFNDIALSNCLYRDPCTELLLAAMDNADTKRAVRNQLPAGGMLLTCDTAPCTVNSYGNLWIIWQEPSTFAALNPLSTSDNCPTEVTSTYTVPKPRCLYVRFKL